LLILRGSLAAAGPVATHPATPAAAVLAEAVLAEAVLAEAVLAEAGVGEERICPRDAAELAACFAAHAGSLFGYACVLTRGDRALADDLVQGAFEAAAREWATVRSLAEPQRQKWLRTALANNAVSGFRREAAWQDRLPRIEAHYRIAPVDLPAQAFSSIVLERCWRIIKEMPEQQHAVAALRWQQGMKQTEIAVALGITEKTVSVHLTRARRRLVAQLGADYPFASDEEGPS
jgi:RNA polymerase sigma-70 factor (ECF subfamily)